MNKALEHEQDIYALQEWAAVLRMLGHAVEDEILPPYSGQSITRIGLELADIAERLGRDLL